MQTSYWNETGKYQVELQKLSDDLMEDCGKSDSIAGELVRAISKVTYDGFNNCFCNNTSGAVNYLVQELGKSEKFSDIQCNLLTLEEVCNSGGMTVLSEEVIQSLNNVTDFVVEHIQANPELLKAETIDMFDLQDDETYIEDELEDEYYD